MGSLLYPSPPPQYYPGGPSLVPQAESKRQGKRLFFSLLLSLLVKVQGKVSFQWQAVNETEESFYFSSLS